MKYVIYIDVGNLPSDSATHHINYMKESIENQKFFAPDDKILYVVRRNGQTEVCVLV